MPIHLDDLLGTPQPSKPPPSTTLDDVLDYVGAVGKGLLHAVGVPTSIPKTPGELLDATSLFVPNVYGDLHQGYEFAKHEIDAVRGVRDAPTIPRKIQAGVTGVPLVGDPLAAVAEPGIEYGEGTAPTHQANVAAVEGGVNLAALLLAPKVMKAAGERFGTEPTPSEPSGLTPDKAVEARSELSTPSAEGIHLDALLSEPEAETPVRPPVEPATPERIPIQRIDRNMRDSTVDRIWDAVQNDPDWEIQVPDVISKAVKRGEVRSKADVAAVLDRAFGATEQPQPSVLDELFAPIERTTYVEKAVSGDPWIAQKLLGPEVANRYRWLVRQVANEAPESPAFIDEINRIEDSLSPADREELGANRGMRLVAPTSSPRTSGMDVHLDDLLGDGGDIVGDGPAPGKSFVVPKYPWAQNFEIPASAERPATPPSEPVQPSAPDTVRVYRGEGRPDPEGPFWSDPEMNARAGRWFTTSLEDAQRFADEAKDRRLGPGRITFVDVPREVYEANKVEGNPGHERLTYGVSEPGSVVLPEEWAGKAQPHVTAPNTDWLDDFPEAEQMPQQEAPMPAELADELPQKLTSEPKPTSPETVRNMIGTDADAELANAATTRKTFFEKGSAMLRKPSQIFNALLVPGDDVLLKSGPAGQEAVRTTRPIELVRAQAVGKADALYHDMTAGMTSAEKGGMGLLLDGQLDANSPNVTPKMRAAAVEARKFFDDYLARAQDAGTGVEAKQGFFPHFRETPIHDVEKPLPEFQKFGMESPSFHYHQVDDRPGYSLDLGYVMRRYAYNAESELQAIQAFGAADADTISNKISEWGDAIAKQGGDGVLAKKILLEKFNMESPELPSMRKGSRDVAATIGAMNTLTTPIRHIGKYVNSLSQIGFRGAGKGLMKIAEAIVSPEARQEIRASGVSLRNSMDLVIPNTKENAFYRITRALPWIKATKALDAGGRVMTYFGADPWIDETVRVARGDKTYLGSLTQGMRQRAVEDAFNRAHNIFGISEQSIESGDLTPREREYARLAASDVTEFNPERGQLPYAATVGAAGRLFYNLRKFATSQANFMYNNVVKPASYGNIKPMARFLAGSALAGAAAAPLLHMVNRQPDAVLNYFGVPLRPEGDQTWEDWRKNAMVVGALHNLGLIYLMVEGRDVLQAVPMASAGLLGRGLHGAASDFVNAGRVSLGHPNEKDKVQQDLPQWWDEAQMNLRDLDGKNVKDVARSTQMTWLLRKWYREARGLQDQ